MRKIDSYRSNRPIELICDLNVWHDYMPLSCCLSLRKALRRLTRNETSSGTNNESSCHAET